MGESPKWICKNRYIFCNEAMFCPYHNKIVCKEEDISRVNQTVLKMYVMVNKKCEQKIKWYYVFCAPSKVFLIHTMINSSWLMCFLSRQEQNNLYGIFCLIWGFKFDYLLILPCLGSKYVASRGALEERTGEMQSGYSPNLLALPLGKPLPLFRKYLHQVQR